MEQSPNAPSGTTRSDLVPSRPGRRVSASSGMALVEVLVSVALLGLVVVGILPLFSRSLSNNAEGDQLARAVHHSRHHLERLMALPFEAPELTVPNAATELRSSELYSAVRDRWFAPDEFPVGDHPAFSRITRVRQFGVSAVEDGDYEFEDDEAVPGGSPASLVHLKEIEVRVTSGETSTSNTMGLRKAITLRVLRSS